MKTLREKDTKVERELAAFLDEHLYSNKELFKEFARTDGREEQIKGSDLIITTADEKIKRKVVDEKMGISRVNTNLETFSLELSFINRFGKRTIGWFLDESKITDYYLFGWLQRADIEKLPNGKWDYFSITRDNLKVLDWDLVSRKKIIDYLAGIGWDMEKLAKQDTLIRQRGYIKTKDFFDGVSFRYSEKYAEKPINIIVKKEEVYDKLADLKGTISV